MPSYLEQLKGQVPGYLQWIEQQLTASKPKIGELSKELLCCKRLIQDYPEQAPPPVSCWRGKIEELTGQVQSIASALIAINPDDLSDHELLKEHYERLLDASSVYQEALAKAQATEARIAELDFVLVSPKDRKNQIDLFTRQGDHFGLVALDLSVKETLYVVEECIKVAAWKQAEYWCQQALEKEKSEEASMLMLAVENHKTDPDFGKYAASIKDFDALMQGLQRLVKISQGFVADKLLEHLPQDVKKNTAFLAFCGERKLSLGEYQQALEFFCEALTIDEKFLNAIHGREIALSHLNRIQAAASPPPPVHAIYDPFYKTLLSTLNTKFDGIYAVSSGVVARNPTANTDHAASLLNWIPGASLLGLGVQARFGAIFQKRCREITELFTERLELKPQLEEAAQLITERYKNQLSELQIEDCQELARAAADRIYNYLVYTDASLSPKNFGKIMSRGVQAMRLKHGHLKVFQIPTIPTDVEITTLTEKKWTIAGIFDRSGVEHEGKVYYIPEVTAIDLYGLRGYDPIELEEPNAKGELLWRVKKPH